MAHRALDLRSPRVVPLGGLVVEFHRREVRVDCARRRHAHRSAVVQVGATMGNVLSLRESTESYYQVAR